MAQFTPETLAEIIDIYEAAKVNAAAADYFERVKAWRPVFEALAGAVVETITEQEGSGGDIEKASSMVPLVLIELTRQLCTEMGVGNHPLLSDMNVKYDPDTITINDLNPYGKGVVYFAVALLKQQKSNP